MKFNSAKIWPYGIFTVILAFFGAIVFSITFILEEAPVQVSSDMMNYHEAEANANKIIEAKIAFDKKYKIEYITDGLSQESSLIKYKITDLDNNPINDATMKIIITRPDNNNHTQELANFSVENGVYTFPSVKLPLAGRWNVMSRTDIGNFRRYYNVKADTRAKEAFEY